MLIQQAVLSGSGFESVALLQQRPRWAAPAARAAQIGRLAGLRSNEAREAEIARSGCAPATLRRFGDSGEWGRCYVGQSAACPPAVLVRLSEDANIAGGGFTAVENPRTPRWAVLVAAYSDIAEIRQSAALNPASPLRVLERVARDEDENLRWAVAQNERCPDDWLWELAEDRDGEVREAVAANPACSVLLMETLAEHGTRETRMGLTRNPKCPSDVVEKLSEDPDNDVRLVALYRLERQAHSEPDLA